MDAFVVTDSGGDRTLSTQRLCFRHMGILRGLVSGLVSDLSIAEELVQKSLNAIVTRSGECPSDEKAFLAWSRNIVFDRLREYRKRHVASVHPLTEDVVSALADTVAKMDYAWSQRRQALSDCIRRLFGRNREILELRYTRKMTPTRIVKETGLGMGAVSVALVKARSSLLDCTNRTLKTPGVGQKKDFLPLLEGHLEERLDTKQKVELGEELFNSEECRRIYWEYMFQHSALEEILAAEQIELPLEEPGKTMELEEDAVEESPEKTVPEEPADTDPAPPEEEDVQPKPGKKRPKSPETRSFRYEGDPSTSPLPYIIGAFIAVTAIGSVVWSLARSSREEPPPIPVNVRTEVRLGTAAGHARIARGGGSFAISPGAIICDNDRMTTQDETLVVLNAGARLTFWKGSKTVFLIEDMMTDVRMDAGAVEVVMPPETEGAGMTITTKLARFSVAGTRSLVAVGPEYTLLDVIEGSAFVASSSDDKVIEVAAGRCSVIGSDTELLASDRQDDETMKKLAADLIAGTAGGPSPAEDEKTQETEALAPETKETPAQEEDAPSPGEKKEPVLPDENASEGNV